MEVLVGSGQRVGARDLEAGIKRDDVATRAIRRKRDLEHVASPWHRGRRDGRGRAAGAGNPPRVPVRGRERQGDAAAERHRAVRLVKRGALRDGRATRQRGSSVGIPRRQHRRGDLVRTNRDGGLTKRVELGVSDRIASARKTVAGGDVCHKGGG